MAKAHAWPRACCGTCGNLGIECIDAFLTHQAACHCLQAACVYPIQICLPHTTKPQFTGNKTTQLRTNPQNRCHITTHLLQWRLHFTHSHAKENPNATPNTVHPPLQSCVCLKAHFIKLSEPHAIACFFVFSESETWALLPNRPQSKSWPITRYG